MEIGTKIKIEILHVSDDGTGFGIADNKLVIIDKVKSDDDSVRVEVYDILNNTICAKKVPTQRERQQLTPNESPYELAD